MAEPDFRALSAEVAAATRLPSFDTIERRARRHRRRDRIAVAGAVFTTLAVLSPITVAAIVSEPVAVLFGPDPPVVETAPASLSPSPSGSAKGRAAQVAVQTRAIGGPDLDQLFAAVDVCTGSVCSLQISPLSARGPTSPVVVGQLRQAPGDPLTDVSLTTLTSRSLLLTGIIAGHGQRYARVSTTGGATVAVAPKGSETLDRDDRSAQLTRYGELYAAPQDHDRLSRIATQPPLDRPVLAPEVAADRGWWVTGLEPATGEPAVAVSRDQGRTWLTRRIGTRARAGDTDPVLATADGRTAYVLVRNGRGLTVARTTDGGQNWQALPAALPPGLSATGGRMGAVVRPDGSLLAWLEETPTPVYLESTDFGLTFHSSAGPGAAVVAVPGGYVAVSQPPSVSHDARTWHPLPQPGYIPPA